ncbi:unnamed protein product, partial [Allacma fusca]
MGTNLVDGRVTIKCQTKESTEFLKEKVGTMTWTPPDVNEGRRFKGWEPQEAPSKKKIIYGVSVRSKGLLDWDDFRNRLRRLNQGLALNTDQWRWWNKEKIETAGWLSTGENKFLVIGVDKESA